MKTKVISLVLGFMIVAYPYEMLMSQGMVDNQVKTPQYTIGEDEELLYTVNIIGLVNKPGQYKVK